VDVAEASSPECQSLGTESSGSAAASLPAVQLLLPRLLGKPLPALYFFLLPERPEESHQTASQTHAFGGFVFASHLPFFSISLGSRNNAVKLMT